MGFWAHHHGVTRSPGCSANLKKPDTENPKFEIRNSKFEMSVYSRLSFRISVICCDCLTLMRVPAG